MAYIPVHLEHDLTKTFGPLDNHVPMIYLPLEFTCFIICKMVIAIHPSLVLTGMVYVWLLDYTLDVVVTCLQPHWLKWDAIFKQHLQPAITCFITFVALQCNHGNIYKMSAGHVNLLVGCW